jgi:hypothetical protein
MHPDLQFAPHVPQLLHIASSSRILKTEIRDIKPRVVPTGHTVLQYRRPFLIESLTTRININKENPKEIQLYAFSFTG